MAEKSQKQNLLSIGEASDHLGVSIDTLRRWEKKGKIESFRSPGNHRYFALAELDNLFGKKYQHDSQRTKSQQKEIPETKPSQISTTEVKKAEEVSKDTLTHKSFSPPTQPIFQTKEDRVLDRPVRDVTIPTIEMIRVIEEKKETIVIDENIQSENIQSENKITPVSILTPAEPPPPTTNKLEQKAKQIKEVKEVKEVKEQEKDNVVKNNLLIYAIITVTVLIVIATIFFIIGVTSQQMLSPLP